VIRSGARPVPPGRRADVTSSDPRQRNSGLCAGKRRGRELLIEDVDVFDGTPLLDSRPCTEGFGLRLGTRGGRTEQVTGEEFARRGERRPGSR
jgi:hypothetical protein